MVKKFLIIFVFVLTLNANDETIQTKNYHEIVNIDCSEVYDACLLKQEKNLRY